MTHHSNCMELHTKFAYDTHIGRKKKDSKRSTKITVTNREKLIRFNMVKCNVAVGGDVG